MLRTISLHAFLCCCLIYDLEARILGRDMDDDDDDYFKDSLVLDENDLALLQEEEDKYASAQEVPAVEVPPSPKRQKTRHDTEMDMVYETPEIILRNDGTYGVRNDVEEVNGECSGYCVKLH